RDLRFGDKGGINCFSNEVIFEQPTLMRKDKSRKTKRKDTELPQTSVLTEHVADEAVNEEMDKSLESATIIATSLDAEQDRGNISETQSKETPNEPSSLGTSSVGGPRRQDTMGDTIAQTRSENASKFSNDPPFLRVNTLGSGEDRMKLKELMELCTKLSDRVLNLETIKTVQAKEIANLKKRVKRLERKRKSRSHGLKRLYKVRLSARVESSEDKSLGEEDASKQGRKIMDIDADEELTLVDETTKEQGRLNAQDEIMFDVNADLQGEEMVVDKEVLLKEAQNVQNVVEEVIEDITIAGIEETVSTAAPITIVVTINELTLAQALAELKSAKPKIDKVVIQQMLGTTTTIAVTAANTRPKAEKQEQLTDAEKAKLFMEFLEKRRKFFPSKRAKEKRNKHPTKAQQRSLISKRARDELKQERSKKQKVEDDKEFEELKKCLKIIPDDGNDVTIDATPLSVKTKIVDYKIYKEERKRFFQIIRVDGNSQMYLTFSKMLKNFDREDLEVLGRLVKDKFVKTKPVDDMDSFLMHILKTIFEHHVEDTVWKSQQGLTKVKS
nr:hypothetical protein [Tanacetum cinerariifolium]